MSKLSEWQPKMSLHLRLMHITFAKDIYTYKSKGFQLEIKHLIRLSFTHHAVTLLAFIY